MQLRHLRHRWARLFASAPELPRLPRLSTLSTLSTLAALLAPLAFFAATSCRMSGATQTSRVRTAATAVDVRPASAVPTSNSAPDEIVPRLRARGPGAV